MISVIIPSYNSEGTIGRCLDSVMVQSYGGEREVIVVDSSHDHTPDVIIAHYPGVTLIRLGRRTDPGTARNVGIARAAGEIIAFLDSDCVAATDWLERIAAAHGHSYRVVGGSVQNGNEDNNLIAWAGYIAEFREYIPQHAKREVTHIPTCNISYKRTIFDAYGVFQGEFYPQEDLVFNHRLSTRGERILFDPTIQVRHYHRTTWREFCSHQERIGHVTAKVLRKIETEGSFVARHPVLAAGVIPLLPFVKFLRTMTVFLQLHPQVILKHPAAALVFAAGLVSWVIGLAKGIYEEEAV
jgi:glycosyltransferase involved in cell wall biosynthesis